MQRSCACMREPCMPCRHRQVCQTLAPRMASCTWPCWVVRLSVWLPVLLPPLLRGRFCAVQVYEYDRNLLQQDAVHRSIQVRSHHHQHSAQHAPVRPRSHCAAAQAAPRRHRQRRRPLCAKTRCRSTAQGWVQRGKCAERSQPRSECAAAAACGTTAAARANAHTSKVTQR
jgi:hypothetical protein